MKRPAFFGLAAGSIWGLILIATLYTGSTWMYTKMSLSTLYSIGLPLVIMVFGGLRERKLQGGFMTYGEALKVTFIICFITGTTGSVFGLLYHNVLNRGYFERNRPAMLQAQEETQRWVLETMGTSEAHILELLEEGALQREDQLKLTESTSRDPLKVMGADLLWAPISMLLALLVALIIRRNPKAEAA